MLNRIKSCNISQYSQHIEEFENFEVYPKDAKLAITRIHTDLLNLILVSIVPPGKKCERHFIDKKWMKNRLQFSAHIFRITAPFSNQQLSRNKQTSVT